MGRGGRGERTVGESQHELTHRAALLIVGIEQRLRGHPAADQTEFPAKVPGILDAGVHALRTDRAVNMRGVTGQKDAIGTITGGMPVMQAERRGPHRVMQAEPATRGVVGEPLQLREGNRPSASGAVALGGGPVRLRSHGDDPPRSRMLERKEQHRAAVGDERIDGAGLQTLHLEIGEQERLRVPRAHERNPCSLPDGAAGSVASDHIARTYQLLYPVSIAKHAGQPPGIATVANELHAPLDRDTARGQVVAEHRLRLRLRDEQQEREGGVLQAHVEQPRTNDPAPAWIRNSTAGLPRETSSSANPRPRSTSRVRGCTASARDSCTRSSARSTFRTVAPNRCSCAANASPVGPAPTTSTSHSSSSNPWFTAGFWRRSGRPRPEPDNDPGIPLL
jgi:hypothetical protein